MRLKCGLLPVLVSMAAMSIASAALAGPGQAKRRCVTPNGWRVFTRSTHVVIVAVGGQWRYCVRATNRFRTARSGGSE